MNNLARRCRQEPRNRTFLIKVIKVVFYAILVLFYVIRLLFATFADSGLILGGLCHFYHFYSRIFLFKSPYQAGLK